MAQTFDGIQSSPAQIRIFIVGRHIAGEVLAFHLHETHIPHQLILLDRSIRPLAGSGYAFGLVGQLNENPVLAKLAKDSIHEYLTIPGAFDVVDIIYMIYNIPRKQFSRISFFFLFHVRRNCSFCNHSSCALLLVY
jgi:hypothetical protein